MKLLALAAVMMVSGTMVGQAPVPVTRIEPVTQPVLHCPKGWHVEVWHPAFCPDCAQFGPFFPPPDMKSSPAEYEPYHPPIAITIDDHATDKEHPAKCVADPKPAATPVAKHEEDCVIDRTYRGKVLCDDGTVIVDHRGDIEDAVLPQANNAPQLSVTTYAGLIEYKPMSNDDHRVEAFDFNSPGPIAWKDPYYVKYKSGWMCTRELVEKRDTICLRMLESFHWEWFDCTKNSVVCRDVKK